MAHLRTPDRAEQDGRNGKGGGAGAGGRKTRDSEPPFAIERKDKRIPKEKVLDKWQTGAYDPYPMQVKRNNFMRPGSGGPGK